MKKDDQSLTPLKDIISNLLGNTDLPFNPDDARIWEVWEEAVGPAIAKNARPSWIKNQRLRVSVSNSVWLQELEFAGENIKERLNRMLEREAVKTITFRIGSI